jgi:hypothetical protein
MDKMSYSTKREFRIWHYTVSHSTLFLRSNVFEESEDGKEISNDTIDIEFWAVGYIDLPDTLKGIELKLVSKDPLDRFREFLKHDLKLFELKTGMKSHFIIAGGCVVGKSTWDYDKGRFENIGLKYPEVIVTL